MQDVRELSVKMEILWQNLKVPEFYNICRLCLENKELEPLAEEEKSILIKLTPWIACLETQIFFPNKICFKCAIQLQKANEFYNRCNVLANSFHKCLEAYKICVKEDNRLPSLEALLLTTKVKIEQEVVQVYHEDEENSSTVTSCTEVKIKEEVEKVDQEKEEESSTIISFTPVDIKREQMEFEGTDNVGSIESTSGIPASDKPELSIEEPPTEMLCLEKSEIINILKSSSKGKLVFAHFEKHETLNNKMRGKLVDSLIENLLMDKDNSNKKIKTADLSKLAESIVEIFPTERKEIYLKKWKKGKFYFKFHNLRRQFQIAGLIPKSSIESEEDTESGTDTASGEDAPTTEDIKKEEMEIEETKFTVQQVTSNSIESIETTADIPGNKDYDLKMKITQKRDENATQRKRRLEKARLIRQQKQANEDNEEKQQRLEKRRERRKRVHDEATLQREKARQRVSELRAVLNAKLRAHI